MRGTVLRVSESEVIVDVGYKSEGMIALEEFRDENGQILVKAGDSVDVLIEKTEDRDGYVVLSKEKAEKMKVWDDVAERAYQERRVVVGRVIERVKGGLVDIGVAHSLPGQPGRRAAGPQPRRAQGQELRMRVIKVNKKRGNIVLSRRPCSRRRTPSARRRRSRRSRRASPHRLGQEHHRVRRIRGPGRHRRPAAHHRHVVGAAINHLSGVTPSATT